MTTEEHAIFLMRQFKQYLKDNNIQQNELAERSGIHFTCVSRMVNGTQLPNFYNFCRLLEALGLDIKLVKAEKKEDSPL